MKPKKAPLKKTENPKTAKPGMEERFRHYVGVLMEDVNSKFKQIMECFTTVATKEDLHRVEDELKSVKFELHVVKQVVSGHSVTLNEHSGLLNEHSVILNEHSVKLNELSAKLDQKADKEDIREIKTVLSDHERRLVHLEQK